jgi:hypothetical protein
VKDPLDLADVLPSPENMQRIRLRALAYLKAWRNWQEDMAHHEQHGVRKDPTSISAMSQAFSALTAVMKESQAASPLGHSEQTQSVLTKLRLITAPHLNRLTPSNFPELERLVQEHIAPKVAPPEPAMIRPDESKQKRLKPGEAKTLILAVLYSIAEKGEWNKSVAEIIGQAKVSRSTYYNALKHDEDVQKALDEFRGRRLGRGPERADSY